MEQVQKKIEAIRELFGDKEVVLPVTFKIIKGNVTAEIGSFIVNEIAKKPEPEISKNDSHEQILKVMNKYVGVTENVSNSFGEKMLEGHTVLGSIAKENEDADERPCVSVSESAVKAMHEFGETDETLAREWMNKLPTKFIALAVRYNGLNRFAYHTLHNEGGIIKAQWKNTLTGELQEWPPYVTVRDYAQGSMNYLMNLCNPDNAADRWRDFDVFKIAPGNWNSVVKETLSTDPKAEESALTVVVYDIYMKTLQLVHFNEEELGAIQEAIAKAEAAAENEARHFGGTYRKS